MKEISFGQYYPAKSVIHRLDARLKVLITIAYMVLLFFIPTLSSFMKRGGNTDDFIILLCRCYAILLGFILLVTILSRVPILTLLKSFRGLIFLIIFMSLLTVFYYGGEVSDSSWTWKWKFLTLSTESITNAAAMITRMIFLFLAPSLLTLTTTPVEFTNALESLLFPLKLLRIPVHTIALVMSLALRLIPTLSSESQKIINAQRARGADFDSRNIFKKAKSLLPILIPLFLSSFMLAVDLSYAMTSRCYSGGKGRTRMKSFRLGLRDLFAALSFVLLFVFVLNIRYNWIIINW